jgi:hypothetical protein
VTVLLGWGRAVALAEAAGLAARRNCFLDKMCIDQRTSESRARGIDQVGRFLYNSEELLILWSPDYFSRLWCCFEMAVYLHLLQTGDGEPGSHEIGALERQTSTLKKQSNAQPRKIVVVPVALVRCGLLLFVFCTLGLLALRLTTLLGINFARDSNLYLALRTAFALCFFVPMSAVFRDLAKSRRELNNQMRSFTFSEARSLCEEDRHLLQHIISVTYRSGDPADSGDDGMARFEQHVRSRMPTVVNSLLGQPSVLPTKLLALLGSTFWIYCLDGVAARASLPAALFGGARGKALYLAANITWAFALSFGVVPLIAATTFALASIRLGPKRAPRGAELTLAVLTVLVPCAVLIGGSGFTQFLFRRLPNALSIPANLLVLGVAMVLTTVRSPRCAGLLGAWGGRRAFAARVGPALPLPTGPMHALPAYCGQITAARREASLTRGVLS